MAWMASGDPSSPRVFLTEDEAQAQVVVLRSGITPEQFPAKQSDLLPATSSGFVMTRRPEEQASR